MSSRVLVLGLESAQVRKTSGQTLLLAQDMSAKI